MALHADTEWDVKTSGSNNNGGGFYNRDPGTSVDYSQQDAAQFNPVDLATPGAASTTLTSVGGGFTAAMAGNIIQIVSGTNFTAGFYEITVHTDTNTVTLDRSPTPGAAGGGDGVGYVGGAHADFWTNFNVFAIPGHHIHVEAGTYSLTGFTNLSDDGTAVARITFEGYSSSHGDTPRGNSRPLVEVANHGIMHDQFHIVLNFRYTLVYSNGVRIGAHSVMQNCYANNSSGSANLPAFKTSGNQTMFIDCEAESVNGYAISLSNYDTGRAIGCWVHDSARGFYLEGNGPILSHCTISDCTAYGVFNQADCPHIVNNSIYNCVIGVYVNPSGNVIINNILDSNSSYGVGYTSQSDGTYVDYNNYYNNTADMNNITKGPNATAYETKFTRTLSGTDLACADHAGAGGYTVTSAAGGFTAGMVGDYFYITDTGATAHFVPGMYIVDSYTNANTIALTTDPTDGNDETAGDFHCHDFSLQSDSQCIGAGFSITLSHG